MRKRIAHLYLLVSLVILTILISLNNYGVFDNIHLDLTSYKNSTNDMIFSFFHSIPIIFICIILAMLLFIKRDTRKFANILILQLVTIFILLSIGTYVCDSLNLITEYNAYVNQDIIYLYSTFMLLILNFNKVVRSGCLKILVLIAMILFLIMLTASEFYFGNLTVFTLLLNITLVCAFTSFTYVLLFIRKYYFL